MHHTNSARQVRQNQYADGFLSNRKPFPTHCINFLCYSRLLYQGDYFEENGYRSSVRTDLGNDVLISVRCSPGSYAVWKISTSEIDFELYFPPDERRVR